MVSIFKMKKKIEFLISTIILWLLYFLPKYGFYLFRIAQSDFMASLLDPSGIYLFVNKCVPSKNNEQVNFIFRVTDDHTNAGAMLVNELSISENQDDFSNAITATSLLFDQTYHVWILQF